MGKKLDSVKKTSIEGSDIFKEGQALSKKAVSDTKKMKSLIESLPTDVDEEIVEAVNAVEQGTKSDAIGYMRSEVQSKVNEGNEKMQESSTQAKEQIRNNDQVINTFAQMDSVGGFGKEARGTRKRSIENSTQGFNEVITKNDTSINDAQREFEKDLSDISSTF